jgi:hypothetical protein
LLITSSLDYVDDLMSLRAIIEDEFPNILELALIEPTEVVMKLFQVNNMKPSQLDIVKKLLCEGNFNLMYVLLPYTNWFVSDSHSYG